MSRYRYAEGSGALASDTLQHDVGDPSVFLLSVHVSAEGRNLARVSPPSTVVVAVVVNRFSLLPVVDYGDDYGSRLPPVIPFSLDSPTAS